MDLATLGRRMGTEGSADDLAQRLGAIDNEPSAVRPVRSPRAIKTAHNRCSCVRYSFTSVVLATSAADMLCRPQCAPFPSANLKRAATRAFKKAAKACRAGMTLERRALTDGPGRRSTSPYWERRTDW